MTMTTTRFPLLLMGVTFLTACTTAAPSPTVTSITISGTNSIPVGSTIEMTATAVRSDGSTETVTGTATWQSSNTAVATVSAEGHVLAVAPGTSVISAAFGGRTGQISLAVVAVDNVQRVRVTLTRVVIDGTCDNDSLFESPGDGEFSFEIEVERSGTGTTTIWETAKRPFTLGSHTLTDVGFTFNRNVTRGEDFILRFFATEWDGLLGPDPKLNGVGKGQPFVYQNGRWVPDATSLSVGSGACGVTIHWTLSSVPQ
jgi:hypothetical protein